MKTHRMSLLAILLFWAAFIEGRSQPIHRPAIEETYHPTGINSTWELSTEKRFRYNSKGDITLVTIYDKEEVPVSRDSMVYNASNQLTEIHKFAWNKGLQRFEYVNKLVNCYENGKSCGSLVYVWEVAWKLTSGSEISRTYDQGSNTETIVSRYFVKEDDAWKNMNKEELHYDENSRLKVKTLYTANPVTNQFELFSRHTYKGWHNYEKSIYNELINEKYVSGAWVMESTSQIVKTAGIYVNTETRSLENKTYRIFFNDNNTYREVMQASGPGWLIISVYNQKDNVETLVENGFEEDILKTIHKMEIRVNELGRVIKHRVEESTAAGDVLQLSDVVHELSMLHLTGR